jgi:hypothetical protein
LRHREGDESISAAAVCESARILGDRMTLAGRTQRAARRSEPAAHPLQGVTVDLLEAVRSLAESVAVLVNPFPAFHMLPSC